MLLKVDPNTINSECVEWKYVNYMKNIFQSIGLDHYHYGNFNTNIFKHFFGKAVQNKELSRRLEMSSLSNYSTFNISLGKQAYLCSINDFWVSRLKFLARTNYLPLNERLFRRSRIRSLLTYFCYGRCCLAILKMKIFSDFLIGE
jgi:hypothetical protein